MSVAIKLIPQRDFVRVRETCADQRAQLTLLAEMCRANTLAIVKRAGSGHLGTSFSSMDLVTWLYYRELNTLAVGLDHPERDIYFSSKGHDVPGLYAVLHALGVLSTEQVLKLRRLGGLDGHPDVQIKGIESNSGSLGMGISKARGMAWAKRYRGHGGRVFVMIGDGELQEGQNYEGLQAAPMHGISNLTVILDHNKVQSDKLVSEIMNLADLEQKIGTFGWHVERCDGHDFAAIEGALKRCARVNDKPKFLIADTIKGKGVSFMEHPTALKIGKGLYPWHAGAPDDASFVEGHGEIIERINSSLKAAGLATLELIDVDQEVAKMANLEGEPVSQAAPLRQTAKAEREYVTQALGEALVAQGKKRDDLIVLDADLAADCRLRGFETTFPERFVQNGIAEQDMVSMAGGLAHAGLLPVVSSFASFLASRANEQIYNNATEKTKIIYLCHYAGLIPAGPGKSHQSIRDISLFGALPNCLVVQPCNGPEAKLLLDYCVEQATDNCAIRLIIGPSPRDVDLPADYQLRLGCGVTLAEGDDATLFAYGPVMIHEALVASEILRDKGFGLRVINMPWLNRVDGQWLRNTLGKQKNVFVLEDHAPYGGLGDALLNAIAEQQLEGISLSKFAVEGYPACGTPPEALRAHGLDGASVADRIRRGRS